MLSITIYLTSLIWRRQRSCSCKCSYLKTKNVVPWPGLIPSSKVSIMASSRLQEQVSKVWDGKHKGSVINAAALNLQLTVLLLYRTKDHVQPRTKVWNITIYNCYYKQAISVLPYMNNADRWHILMRLNDQYIQNMYSKKTINRGALALVKGLNGL